MHVLNTRDGKLEDFRTLEMQNPSNFNCLYSYQYKTTEAHSRSMHRLLQTVTSDDKTVHKQRPVTGRRCSHLADSLSDLGPEVSHQLIQSLQSEHLDLTLGLIQQGEDPSCGGRKMKRCTSRQILLEEIVLCSKTVIV